MAEETKEELKTKEIKVESTTEPAEKVEVEKVETEEPQKEIKTEDRQPVSQASGKFTDLIKQIEELSVSDLAQLVKELEERFGVSAAAPVAAVAAASGGEAAGGASEEKANYTIMLQDAGAQKIAVIKAIREIRQDLGLKEAKDLVDGAPKEVKADVPKEEAEVAKKKLEAAGAKIELK